MVSKKFLGQINLLASETFYIYKTTKVVVIHEDKNLMLLTF